MDFIDLKTQYSRLKSSVDARIHAVLEHGQYVMGPEVVELEVNPVFGYERGAVAVDVRGVL